MAEREIGPRRCEGKAVGQDPFLFNARRCKGEMIASFAVSLASVGAGFVPFYAVYRLMAMAMDGSLTWDRSVLWLALAAVFYLASKVLFGISTLLSHVSAYTILETLRQDFVRKLHEGVPRHRPGEEHRQPEERVRATG